MKAHSVLTRSFAARYFGGLLTFISAAALGIATAAPAADHGEFVISAYTGMAFTENNDLHLKQPGGTDLTFHDVSYRGRDFEMPPFYGGRLTYFLPDQSHWGVGLEFFHAKLYLENEKSVSVTGTRGGIPVNGVEPINNTISAFSISHGINFATADAFYRWLPGHRGEDFLGRFQPYIGTGVGVVIPHVESQVAGSPFSEEYQIHGPGVLAMAGVNFDLTRHFALFLEYKYAYAHLGNMPIAGGSINIDPSIHNVISGISFRF